MIDAHTLWSDAVGLAACAVPKLDLNEAIWPDTAWVVNIDLASQLDNFYPNIREPIAINYTTRPVLVAAHLGLCECAAVFNFYQTAVDYMAHMVRNVIGRRKYLVHEINIAPDPANFGSLHVYNIATRRMELNMRILSTWSSSTGTCATPVEDNLVMANMIAKMNGEPAMQDRYAAVEYIQELAEICHLIQVVNTLRNSSVTLSYSNRMVYQ